MQKRRPLIPSKSSIPYRLDLRKRWTAAQLRDVVRGAIREYLEGNVEEENVIALGSVIYHDILPEDEALMSATCILDDLAFPELRRNYPSVRGAFQEALRVLEE